MVLNYVWVAFFVIAFLTATAKLIFWGDTEVFGEIMNGTMESAKLGFEISIGLTGVMTLWLGLMRVGEKAGVVELFGKLVAPFFQRLFPEIPENHSATGSILMNFSANMLGLDNAATPLGLKAMKELQTLNPDKDRASNAQIMFLVLNTSGLTLIPINVMVYRAELGAVNPSDIFVPILLATFFSTLTGIIVTAIYQKINLLDRVILIYLGTLSVLVGLIIWLFSGLTQEETRIVSSTASNVILFSIIITFIGLAVFRKINVYETFIEGAKEGFKTAIVIIPYLVAMLVAIGVFRNAGAMAFLIDSIELLIKSLGINADFVAGLPTAIMKPLSGSGARGMMVETMKTYGADSFQGRLASVLQGSTETTFYVLAVYFGVVGIRNTRYAVVCGLLADLAGIMASILLAYLFFGDA